MSHSISRAHIGGFFLSHKLAVVNLFEHTSSNRLTRICYIKNLTNYGANTKHSTFALPMTRHGFDCRASDNRVPCERSEQNTSPNIFPRKHFPANVHTTYIHCTYSVKQTLNQISYSFRCKQRANCRAKITPTTVVYIVHTLYIHV